MLDKLKKFETRLGKFCYSIYSLEPKSFLCRNDKNDEVCIIVYGCFATTHVYYFMVTWNRKLNTLRSIGIFDMSANSLLKNDQTKYFEIKINFAAFAASEKRSADHLKKRYVRKPHLNETEVAIRNEESKCRFPQFCLSVFSFQPPAFLVHYRSTEAS